MTSETYVGENVIFFFFTFERLWCFILNANGVFFFNAKSPLKWWNDVLCLEMYLKTVYHGGC